MNTIPNTTNPTLNECWKMVRGLNDTAKMDLVILLIQSIKKEHSTKKTVDDLYGIFSDDPIYDDEFFEVIREGRNAHREIVEL